MGTHILIAAALALAATVTSANALTVVNADKTSHAVMVTPQGGKVHKLIIKASRSASYNCAKGCEVRMGALKSKFDASVEKVSIKNGKFVKG